MYVRFTPKGNTSRYWLTRFLILSFQYLTGVFSPSTTTLLQEEGLDTSSLMKKSDGSSTTEGLTHWQRKLNFGGGVPTKKDAMNP